MSFHPMSWDSAGDYPELELTVAFGEDIDDDSPLWFDITPDMLELGWRLGRNVDTEQVATMTLKAILKNFERYLDPRISLPTSSQLVGNPYAETDTAGWVVNAPNTLVRSTDKATAGAASLKWTHVAAGNINCPHRTTVVTAGTHTWWGRVWIPSTYDGGDIRLFEHSYDSNSFTIANLGLRDQWQWVTHEWSTTTDLSGLFLWQLQSVPSVGEVLYFDHNVGFDGTDQSPYFGITAEMQIRLRGKWNSIEYDLFRGITETWDQSWDLGMQTVNVGAAGPFKVLNLAAFDDAWDKVTNKDSPTYWLKLNDLEGEETVRNFGQNTVRLGTPDGATLKGVQFEQEGGIESSPNNKSVRFQSTVDQRILLSDQPNLDFADTFTLEILFKLATGSMGINGHNPTLIDKGTQFHLHIGNSGKMFLSGGSSGLEAARSMFKFEEEVWYHCMIGHVGNVTTMFINGIDYARHTANITFLSNSTDMSIGNDLTNSNSEFDGLIDEVIFYDFAVGAASTVPWNKYLLTRGLLSSGALGDRLEFILDAAGWSAARRDIDTTTLYVPQKGVSGSTTVLSVLQAANRVEDGLLLEAPNGDITYQNVGHRYTNHHTPVKTFGEGTGEFPYVAAGTHMDDKRLATEVVVQDGSGNTHILKTATDPGFTKRTRSISSDHLSGELAKGLGFSYLKKTKDPLPHMDAIQVIPVLASGATEWWPVVLDQHLGERHTITHTPFSGIPGGSSDEIHIESFAHNITQGTWAVAVNISLANMDDVWLIGHATRGKLNDTAEFGWL